MGWGRRGGKEVKDFIFSFLSVYHAHLFSQFVCITNRNLAIHKERNYTIKMLGGFYCIESIYSWLLLVTWQTIVIAVPLEKACGWLVPPEKEALWVFLILAQCYKAHMPWETSHIKPYLLYPWSRLCFGLEIFTFCSYL